ncbi:hypothetical protein BKA62DRAFT_701474 [Auriculariales sp. MPI-PUGE-AT-0066]|nr:hypothetical protein BKA62DRAFT_701474 [Auriculariales sp. MPI-PUGE-AT-0066]
MSGDYDKKYPPDRPGEEAGADARVWRVYRDRASDVDEDIIGGWNKTLDVLLIFAGLFSAVATALLVEAQKQLEPDQAKYLTAAFLAVHLNQSISDDRFNPATYAPSLQARWVAALWLVSLVIALVVALLAILAKQCEHQPHRIATGRRDISHFTEDSIDGSWMHSSVHFLLVSTSRCSCSSPDSSYSFGLSTFF